MDDAKDSLLSRIERAGYVCVADGPLPLSVALPDMVLGHLINIIRAYIKVFFKEKTNTSGFVV